MFKDLKNWFAAVLSVTIIYMMIMWASISHVHDQDHPYVWLVIGGIATVVQMSLGWWFKKEGAILDARNVQG